jgi:cysteine desulfurase
MAEALSLADAERFGETARLTALRDRLIDGMLRTRRDVRLTGHPTKRLPGHASFAFSDRSGESVLVDLDHHGIMCSSGSACHAGMTDPSHVLLAIGLSQSEARNGLRMTLGRDTDEADIDQVLSVCSTLLRNPVGSVSAV